MTIHLHRVGSRVPQNYTVDQAFRTALVMSEMPHDAVKLVQAIFSVLTESQQLRVLESVGWVRCPGPAIEAAPAHHSA